jgi:hypothetical protein
MKKLSLLLSTLLLVIVQAWAQTLPPITKYNINKTSETILIDGNLDEASWSKVPFTENFVDLSSFSKKVVNQTKAKMMWDETNMYIAFVCEDTSMWATLSGKDKPLFDQDVVEVLIDPDGDGLNYAEFGFSPNAQIYDLFMTKGYSFGGTFNSSWDIGGMKVGVVITGTLNTSNGGKQWVVEVSFPWSGVPTSPLVTKIKKPLANDIWRLNLARPDKRYLNPAKQTTFYTWSYTGAIDNHLPSRFGEVTFLATDIYTSIENIEIVNSNIQVFPNPTVGLTKFIINSTKEENIEFYIYDAYGTIVSKQSIKINQGENVFKWNASTVNTGIYCYKIIVENKEKVGKILVN